MIDAIIFVSIDVLSLVVQAIGGGVASAAVQKKNGHEDRGGHIMLGKYSAIYAFVWSWVFNSPSLCVALASWYHFATR